MTDDPRAQSEQAAWTIAKARTWLLNLAWPSTSAETYNTPKVRATAQLLSELGAAHDVKDAEIARLKLFQNEIYGSGKQLEGELRQRAQDAEAALAACCAENATLQAELAMATDAANKGDDARTKAGAMQDQISDLRNIVAGMFWAGGSIDDKTMGDIRALGLDCRAENAALEAQLLKLNDSFSVVATERDHNSKRLSEVLAENAALAKLADELSVDHRDDDTFDAGVRYALFILGFEKEAVEANDASKALRAGQQKDKQREEIEIVLNGRTVRIAGYRGLFPVQPGAISYEDAINWAGYPGRCTHLTVTYTTMRAGDEQRQGSLTSGQSTPVEDGMVFNVSDTSRA